MKLRDLEGSEINRLFTLVSNTDALVKYILDNVFAYLSAILYISHYGGLLLLSGRATLTSAHVCKHATQNAVDVVCAWYVYISLLVCALARARSFVFCNGILLANSNLRNATFERDFAQRKSCLRREATMLSQPPLGECVQDWSAGTAAIASAVASNCPFASFDIDSDM